MAKVASSPRKNKPKQKPSSKQPKAKTCVYRVQNWPAYNNALRNRGSLTFWFSEEAILGWYYDGPSQQGAQYDYSDLAIQTALTFRSLFRLPFRQTQGFVQSLIDMMQLGLRAPDYSTLCRRQEVLSVDLGVKPTTEPVHVVIDSTGAKVFGEGEWKVRQHGWSKRRTWRKLHLAVDEATGEILAETLTTNSVDDASQVNPLLAQIRREIEAMGADGAYDKETVYAALEHSSHQHTPIPPIIPPRRNAKIQQHGNCKEQPLPRDENLRRIRQIGRQMWKQESGYHRRSIAETAMSRYKRTFGAQLLAHTLVRQKVEARTNCAILNRMADLGRPDSVKMQLTA